MTKRARKRLRVAVFALGGLVALSGCRSVTGHFWLPVYSSNEEALGRIDVHFTANCDDLDERKRTVPVVATFKDTVKDVRFDAQIDLPICRAYDSVEGVYGRFQGVYQPAADWQGLGRWEPGRIIVQFTDMGRRGFSEGDYACMRLMGGTFRDYELPALHDVDDDGFKDEGCSFLGGGEIQLNLGSTSW